MVKQQQKQLIMKERSDLGGICVKPGRTQTGMSSYWAPYISLLRLHETSLINDVDQSDFVSVPGPRRETLPPVLVRTALM